MTRGFSNKGVLCIGAIMVDILCEVSCLPKRGEGAVTTSRVMSLGGCAFNSGNVIRQLGAPCYLLAPLGSGFYAQFVRESLAARNLQALEVDSELDCGVCTCLVEPDGERTMITSPGIERQFEATWFENFDTSPFAIAIAAGYEIEGQGGDAIISFIEEQSDLEFYYAPGPRIMGVSEEKHARINALHPVWHLNDLEALQFTHAETVDEAGKLMAQMCGNACVITCGSKGSAVYLATGEKYFAETTPVKVVDTVGAGDSHVGALAAARAAGYSWQQALVLANRVAGIVCTAKGGTVSDDVFNRNNVTLAS